MNIELKKGNCFDMIKDIPDNSIDLIITDPPYWHKKSPGKPYSQRNQSNSHSILANSDMYNFKGDMIGKMSDFNEEQINNVLEEYKRVMKKMNVYIFCNDTQVPYYCMWAEKNNFLFSILIWEKPLRILNHNRYAQNVEYIVRIYDYGTSLNKLDNNELYNKIKRVPLELNKHKIHPSQKPVELIEQFLLVNSKENDTILDTFMGGGTIGVACIKNNRNFIGIELEEEYFEIAKDRIEIAMENIGKEKIDLLSQ